jgi:hypothetical protein
LQLKNSCNYPGFIVYCIWVEILSKKDRLIARLKTKPKDFTFDEAKTLLEYLGYVMNNSGKTSGSRVCFTRAAKVFRMHKPHPRNELLHYQINELIDELEEENLI